MERRVPAASSITLVNPTKSANLSPMENGTPVPRIRTQSSPLIKANLSAVSQWRSSRAAQQRATGIPIHLHGKSAIFRQWRVQWRRELGMTGSWTLKLRNLLGIWRWRMHATWELLIAWCNRFQEFPPHQTPSRGGVPAVRTANSGERFDFFKSPTTECG